MPIMNDIATAAIIGALSGIPVTVIGNWIAINVKARRR